MDLSKRASLPREVRRFEFNDIELRAASNGDTLTFTGEASVVEHPYVVRDMFGEFEETISRGAFDKTLSENPDVVFLINHEGLPLARTSSGTLKLSTNPNLSDRAELDPTDPDVARIEKKMKRGDLNEMSFAFRVTKQNWNEDYTQRQITEVSLARGDVSIVTFGANPATTSSLRSLDGMDADDLDDALAAAKDGTLDADQRALLERASRAITRSLREARMSNSDLEDLLEGAVAAQFGTDTAPVCVEDFTDTWVVYEVESGPDAGYHQVNYSLDGTSVSFSGDPVPVAVSTAYTPRNQFDPEEARQFVAHLMAVRERERAAHAA